MSSNDGYVYFIGAGPGDPDLITVKGLKIIQSADLIMYAGSLVPIELLEDVKHDAEVVDSSGLALQEIHNRIIQAVRKNGLVARLHTGDPALYGAIKEQMFLLDQEGIGYEVIPGITAAFAAAAKARLSLTLPEKTQTLIFTRLSGRTSVPARESLERLAEHQSSLALYLSSDQAENAADQLIQGGYAPNTPVLIAYRIGWPEEKLVFTDLRGLPDRVKASGLKRQAVFLVLPHQDQEPVFSKLYSPDFSHGFREAKENEQS